MTRKRSVVWNFFEETEVSVRCLLCQTYQLSNPRGTTTAMLKHLRVKHPDEVPMAERSEEQAAEPSGAQADTDMDGDRFSSVEVALEETDSDNNTAVNESDINSAINGILQAAKGRPVVKKDDDAGGYYLSKHTRSKRSSVWRHFEHLDSLSAARCRICKKKLKYFDNTSNLLRHISKRHPDLIQQSGNVLKLHSPISSQAHNGDGNLMAPLADEEVEQKGATEVEVALEETDSDNNTAANESDINSAINGILQAAKGRPVEKKDDDAGGYYLSRHTRSKRSSVWRHFEYLDSLNAARCRICKKKLKYFDNTSNLLRHISKRHPELIQQSGNVLKLHSPISSQAHNGDGDFMAPLADEEVEQRGATDALKASPGPVGDRRAFRRERELIEALRRAQREEARALEIQREFLKKLREVGAREAAAEKAQIESLRKTQQEEAKDLNRQREELNAEKEELQKKWERLRQDREELLLFPREQPAT